MPCWNKHKMYNIYTCTQTGNDIYEELEDANMLTSNQIYWLKKLQNNSACNTQLSQFKLFAIFS